MRIAALVHNGVLKDARVIKEARTLRLAGHEVEIHGLALGSEMERHVLPGTDIEVFLHPRLKGPSRQPPPAPSTQKMLFKLVNISAALFVITIASVLVAAAHILLRAQPFGMVLFSFLLLISLLSGFGFFLRNRFKAALILARRTVLKSYSIGRRILGVAQRNIKLLYESVSQNGHFPVGKHQRNYATISAALFEGLAQRTAPDAIHLHDHVSLMAARRLRKTYRVPIIWDAHEIYEDLAASDPIRGRANAQIIKSNAPFIDAFITINESIAKFYRDKYKFLPSPIVLMNATSMAPFPNYDGRLHKAAGLPREQKILLFQGGLAPKRGLHHLVEAAAQLAPDWTLVIMGWGNLQSELEALCQLFPRKGDWPATVFIPGVPQHELQEWSAGATLGAIPYENTSLNHLYCTPNKLWEYPAAGVPVLCTDLVEMSALVRAHEIGFLLPRSFCARDIADTINNLSMEDLLRARANCASFIQVSNWESFAVRLIRLYSELQVKPLESGASPAAIASKLDVRLLACK